MIRFPKSLLVARHKSLFEYSKGTVHSAATTEQTELAEPLLELHF